MRWIVLMMLAGAVGCVGEDGGKGKKETGEPAAKDGKGAVQAVRPLTADEKNAWAKKRKIALGNNPKRDRPPHQVAGYLTARNAWRSLCLSDRGEWTWSGQYPHNFRDSFDIKFVGEEAKRTKLILSGIDGAKKSAMGYIEEPSVKAAVVLDLYTAESPRAVVWYQHTDGKTTSTTTAPTPDLDASFRLYLFQLQVRADEP